MSRLSARATSLTAVGVLVVLLAAAAVASSLWGSHDAAPHHNDSPAGPIVSVPSSGTDSLVQAITRTQAQLASEPTNWNAWAALGFAYVQQGRITADPSYYPKAETALRRSLALNASANYLAMTGMGALAAARHDFASALSWGKRALAIDPRSAGVYGVIDDAYTQLGDYAQARAAVQQMLNLGPGVASWSRVSYDFEERGLVVPARKALEQALIDASSGADIAFCHYYLGELAFTNGQLTAASAEYAASLRADPRYVAGLEGRAKVEAARGERDAAVRDYTAVIGQVPLPQYVVEFGDYLTSIGRTAQAAQQYAVLRIEEQLFAAAGVTDDLVPAEFDANHGNPGGALQHARREWVRRHSVLVADALAWALHASGQDRSALTYARKATSLGWRNALFYYHLGMIERSLGERQQARTDLGRALAINPYFDPLQAPLGRQALLRLNAGA